MSPQGNRAHAPVAVGQALNALRAGGLIVLRDDVTEFGHAYLVAAAQSIRALDVAFLVRHSSGFVQVAISDSRADELDLPPMRVGWRRKGTPTFTVSVDASAESGTGISAHDRACTIQALGSLEATSASFRRPGHVVPIAVSRAPSHTDGGAPSAALQLVFAAESGRAAAMAALTSEEDHRHMARPTEALGLGQLWNFPVVDVSHVRASLGASEF